MTKTWRAAWAALGIGYVFVWALGQTVIPDPVQGIFAQTCAAIGCHSGNHPAKSLNLEPAKVIASAVNVPSRQVISLKIIDPKSPGKSYLLMKVRGDKKIVGLRMPKGRDPLTADEIQALKDWIESLADR